MEDIIIIMTIFIVYGVSLKTPRPRGWVRAGRPSGGESSFNKRNMYQYPHVSQLFILTSVAKPGIPGAIKNGWVCTADYRMLLGTAVRPVPARMPYISRLCDVGATDVKRWWWWWWYVSCLLTKSVMRNNLLLFKYRKRMFKCFPLVMITGFIIYFNGFFIIVSNFGILRDRLFSTVALLNLMTLLGLNPVFLISDIYFWFSNCDPQTGLNKSCLEKYAFHCDIIDFHKCKKVYHCIRGLV